MVLHPFSKKVDFYGYPNKEYNHYYFYYYSYSNQDFGEGKRVKSHKFVEVRNDARRDVSMKEPRHIQYSNVTKRLSFVREGTHAKQATKLVILYFIIPPHQAPPQPPPHHGYY